MWSFKSCQNHASTLSWETVAQPLEDSICSSPLDDRCFHIQHVKMSLSPPLLQISNRIIQSSPVAMKTKQKAKGERRLRGREWKGRFYILFCILNRACMWGRALGYRAKKKKNSFFLEMIPVARSNIWSEGWIGGSDHSVWACPFSSCLPHSLGIYAFSTAGSQTGVPKGEKNVKEKTKPLF